MVGRDVLETKSCLTSMDSTFTKVFTLILFVMAISGNSPCGPDSKCRCAINVDMTKSMDCSRKNFGSLRQICDTLGTATHLDASYNNIDGKLDGNLSGCNNLKYLILRYNNISDILSKPFKYMENLIELDLSHNGMNIYTNGKKPFKYLQELKTIKLNGNFLNHSGLIHSYPDLSANKKLTTLHIDGLQSSFDDSYIQLFHLIILDISGSVHGVCNVSYIDDNFFTNLKHLELLNMSYCKIRHIEFNAFAALSNLTSLDLAYNQNLGFRVLYNISHGLQFTNIQMLNYSHINYIFGLGTQVTKRDICFFSNTTLREVVLNGNRIELIETNAFILMPPSLNIIHVEDNAFTFGPYLLQTGCPFNVTDLYANFQNRVHDFNLYDPNGKVIEPAFNYTGHCPFLNDKYLKEKSKNISNCKFYASNDKLIFIPVIPKATRRVYFADSNMKYNLDRVLILSPHNVVEYIDVSGNVFHELIGPFGPLENLKYADLSRNYCTHVGEKFFEYVKVLENLQIHSNFLGLNMSKYSYTRVFHNLTNLQTMNLSINKIVTLHPRLLDGLAKLHTLDLSLNSIEEWNLNVSSLSNLSTVLLKSNSLSSLPYSLMSHLDYVATGLGRRFTVDLRNNVLKYGCKTQRFLEWLVKHRSSFIGFDEYVFVDDDGNSIRNDEIVPKVRALEKQCLSYTVWIVITSIGVSVTLSVIVCSLVYKNRWKIRYFMFMSKQRFYGYVRVPNEPPVENYRYDAFISYAEENIRFVKDQIIPNVEHDRVSLCIHQRNFMPGNAIADNIIEAIKSSRKTVVLLTEAFLKRKWCIYEFNMARMESIYSRDGRSCLLIVMLENVQSKHMPLEMVEWIKNESYLEYTTEDSGKELFWNNLKEAVRS